MLLLRKTCCICRKFNQVSRDTATAIDALGFSVCLQSLKVSGVWFEWGHRNLCSVEHLLSADDYIMRAHQLSIKTEGWGWVWGGILRFPWGTFKTQTKCMHTCPPAPEWPEQGRSETRSQKLLLGLPRGCSGPNARAILCCFSRCSIRELDLKWSTPGFNCHHSCWCLYLLHLSANSISLFTFFSFWS